VVLGSLAVAAAPSLLICIGGLRELEGLPRGGVFSLADAMVYRGSSLSGEVSYQSLQDLRHRKVDQTHKRDGDNFIQVAYGMSSKSVTEQPRAQRPLGARRIWRILAGRWVQTGAE
jgi:hypothetical protein